MFIKFVKGIFLKILNGLSFARLRTKLTALPATLRRAKYLFIDEQIRYFSNTGLLNARFRPRFKRQLYNKPCKVIELVNQDGLCRADHVFLVTERQYAYDQNCYYGYQPNNIFKSAKRFFPHLSLFDIHVEQRLGILGFCRGNYYHDVVDFFFQGYLLKKQGKNIPLLRIGLSKGVETSLEKILQQLTPPIHYSPARLNRLVVGELFVYQTADARIPEYPFNANTGLFSEFRQYIFDIQKLVLPIEMNKGEKIFATRRGGARFLKNNADLEKAFSDLGFSIIDFGEYSFEEQVNISRQAKVMVGLHGANLTNVAFMSSGAKVIEIMPAKKVKDDAYKRLSYIFDLTYERIPLQATATTADVPAIMQDFAAVFDGTRQSS
jgi:hypothetical protein